MKPQGYLGRAYAARHGEALALPTDVNRWSDSDAVRALLAHGHDLIGNLLLGNLARARFTSVDDPSLVSRVEKPLSYIALAAEAANGEVPGSSAGGEQPKFTPYAKTEHGPRHVIVKFSDPVDTSISERWRDLLLAEYLALQTLRAAGVPAAASWGHDHGGQRFLEVERFDRVGVRGRRALFSLLAVDAEFVGLGTGPWPAAARRLVSEKAIYPEAAVGASRLWAFGSLIGNSDTHFGNLCFMTDTGGRPYDLAPCYDMSPMGFAPRSSGAMSDSLPQTILHGSVRAREWRDALVLANQYCAALFGAEGFSPRFSPCIDGLMRHLEVAAERISRLGD
ncbi:MAG: type II toxin-antitoxin system HipA family toxin YjjJ [Dechloromonas sp.]|nr:type II toxin-antitoxin system HipA family toxin YjjJ [Dechloromonas sp.]